MFLTLSDWSIAVMRTMLALGALLIALSVPAPNLAAAENSVASPASTESAFVDTSAVVTLEDVEGLSAEQVNTMVSELTGTDAEVSVDTQTLRELLADEGEYVLPVAASASKPWTDAATSPIAPAALDSAHIEYITMIGSALPKTLRVCANWGASSCNTSGPTGWLTNGQKSNVKFGWSDTDGYHHPSTDCTTYTSFGVITYTFTTPGWVKTGGLNGGTWRVNMYCS